MTWYSGGITHALVIILLAGGVPAEAATIGNVASYTSAGQDVTFNIGDGSKVRISVLTADMVRVRIAPSGTFGTNVSRAVVTTAWPAAPFSVSDSGSAVTITTAEMKLVVSKSPFVLACRDLSDNLILTDDPSRRVQWASGYTRVYKTTQTGENYLGLGWRPSGGIRRNGTQFVMKNVPSYSDPTVFYGGIPMWHGLRNGKDYGLFFDDTSWGQINVGAESSSYMSFENLGGQVDYYFIYGPAMSKVVDRYTELTGRPFMPPKWACGYQQCRWSYTPQSEVLSIASEFRTRQIPCDVIYLDVDYMDHARQLTFDPSTFPNPAAMLSTLHAQGFHSIANISPWLMEGDSKWAYANSNGYLLKNLGASYRGWVDFVRYLLDGSTGWVGWVDFTKSAARSWYASQHTSFLNYGIDGIWNDLNEPDPLGPAWPLTVTYDYDGNTTFLNKASTQYCLLQTQFSYDTLSSHYPDKRPFVLSRGAYAGIQRCSAVWSGDNTSKWDHCQLNIPMGLSMSISGQPHNGHDIGGFFPDPPISENPVPPELYARWMQWGVFSAFCRQHHDGYGNHDPPHPYVEPWRFTPEVEAICKEFIELRYRLMPYLYSLFYEAHTTGAPIHRPTVWDFQADSNTVTQSYDFMFGPFMLISPVYTELATTRSVYLPAGTSWIDFWDDTLRTGGLSHVVSAPFERLPIHVRGGAIIPTGPVMQYAGELPVDVLTLALYPVNETSTFTLYEDDGISWGYQTGDYCKTAYTMAGVGDSFTLDIAERQGSYVPALRDYRLEVHRWPGHTENAGLNGVEVTEYFTRGEFDAANQGLYLDTATDILYVKFADDGTAMTFTFGGELIPNVPGDFDRDGDVDQDDFGHIQGCLTGAIPISDPDCQNADLEPDHFVNQADVSIFVGCMNQPGEIGDPHCAD